MRKTKQNKNKNNNKPKSIVAECTKYTVTHY